MLLTYLVNDSKSIYNSDVHSCQCCITAIPKTLTLVFEIYLKRKDVSPITSHSIRSSYAIIPIDIYLMFCKKLCSLMKTCPGWAMHSKTSSSPSSYAPCWLVCNALCSRPKPKQRRDFAARMLPTSSPLSYEIIALKGENFCITTGKLLRLPNTPGCSRFHMPCITQPE